MTAVIQQEGDLYVALCTEFDVVSQGVTLEEAKCNLIEALELFWSTQTAMRSKAEQLLMSS